MNCSGGRRVGLLLCFLLAILKDTCGQMKPSNAVAEIGGQAIFNCSGTVTAAHWFMSKDGTTTNQLFIAEGCNVKTNVQHNYKTEQIGVSIACNLIVFNVSMEQAGTYWCTSSVSFNALLTVIDSSPVITVNSTTPAVENETIKIACTLKHNGSVPPAPTLQPHFYWTDPNGQNVSTSYNSTTENSAVSQFTVTAGRQDIMSYTCHVYLQLVPTINPSYASNTPTINNSASSPTISVNYNASIPNISRQMECEHIVLTCNSSGNPPPKYRWFASNESVNLSENQSLTLNELDEDYTCEAYNTIRNVTHRTSINYNISENYISLQCNTDPRGTAKILVLTTIILAAVLGGYGLCNIISTIVFLAYYNRKSNSVRENKEKLNARFPWLQRMLPCMNNATGNAGCTFLWVILFILMSILAGLVVFPILVAIVNFSKDSSDTYMSNIGFDDNNQEHSSNHRAAAHRDIENHYDLVGTIHPNQKHTLEEPTSAKDTKAKGSGKVFYTEVNPNFNKEEDAKRYYVSSPKRNS